MPGKILTLKSEPHKWKLSLILTLKPARMNWKSVYQLCCTHLRLSSCLPRTPAGRHIANQVLRAGTSPAPNYGKLGGIPRGQRPVVATYILPVYLGAQ